MSGENAQSESTASESTASETKYHNFEIQPGYVEDSRFCILRVSHAQGFESIEAAMENFRLTLLAHLEGQHEEPESDCCRKALKAKKVKNFCADCGTRLASYAEIDPGSVQDLFFEIPMMTADESHDLYAHFENADWLLGCFHHHWRNEPPCFVQAVGRWMGRDPDDKYESRPWMEGQYPPVFGAARCAGDNTPDGKRWNSRDTE